MAREWDRAMRNTPPTCEVVEKIGILAMNGTFTTELRLIKWNDRAARYDIRAWREWQGTEMPLKGMTLSEDEMRTLYALLKERFEDE